MASCEIPEESDSEGEQVKIKNPKDGMHLSNIKLPGSLSYRRIIFGTDGKIRACFSDKNRNGYGIFSFTETHKQQNESDEYIEPTRRISYWWSGAFEDPQIQIQLQQQQQLDIANNLLKNKKLAIASNNDLSASNNTNSASSNYINNTNSSNNIIKNQEIESNLKNMKIISSHKSNANSKRIKNATYLLDTIQRIYGIDSSPPPFSWPKKVSKSWKILHAMTLFQRQQAECIVIRSCFMAVAPRTQLSLPELFSYVKAVRFTDEKVEACREYLNCDMIKYALRRL
jgi:hypothetical protein